MVFNEDCPNPSLLELGKAPKVKDLDNHLDGRVRSACGATPAPGLPLQLPSMNYTSNGHSMFDLSSKKGSETGL